MERSVLRGLAAFRWAAWVWMAAVLWLARANLVRPGLAVALVAGAFVVTVAATVALVTDPRRAIARPLVGAEVVVALGLQLADGAVYASPHVFTTQQPLGVAWPLAAVLSAGVAFGPLLGGLTGVLAGLTRAVSSVLANPPLGPDQEELLLGLDPEQTLAVLTSTVLYALAGAVAGDAMRRIRSAEARITRAERDLAQARAREEVARRLHDGVLQTLALVERRTDDPQLARLARDQERQLRADLFGDPGADVVGRGDLGDALRAAADRCETAFGLRVDVLVPDDVPDLDADVVDALAGAVGEALTNAGKHAAATRVVVYVEPTDDDGLEVSVRDDGRGYDPATTAERVGTARSIRGRVEELGGHVEVDTAPGRGTEVRLCLTAAALTDR
ncbi:hypothetical protein FTX61_07890 [Nitriliruptoraceae bacterium ZYF776]|nr:hypothetical protein [Profundirhabdus halotolerans]